MPVLCEETFETTTGVSFELSLPSSLPPSPSCTASDSAVLSTPHTPQPSSCDNNSESEVLPYHVAYPADNGATTTLQPETPDSRKVSSDKGYNSGALNAGRNALMDEYCETPEVAVVDFFQAVLPAVSSDMVEKTMAHLVATGSLLSGDNPSWSSFPVRPSESTGSENNKFSALGDICSEIITAFKHLFPGQGEAVELVQRPNHAVPSDRPNTARPDSYFSLIDGNGSRADWRNIVMTCEFKSSNRAEESVQNTKQLLWGMYHVMRNDYRRFTFGLTIEDFTTRVWFCDRSENMVSQPFELDKEPKLLVQLIIALVFASYVDLGFDPTIERLLDGKIAILVRGTANGVPVVTRYIADPRDDVLAEYGADPMNGRGTRVWRVRKEGDLTGAFYVLKDSWISLGRQLEGDFLREFKGDIEKKGAAEDLVLFDKLFMDIAADGLVELGPGKKDCTLETIRRGTPPRADQSVELYAPRQLANALSEFASCDGPVPHSWSRIRAPSATITRKKPYCARKHYRIVFRGWEGDKKEVGKALHELEDLGQILGCLPKLIDAIGLLHRYDRLHRDISTGNVIVRTNNAGKVTDVRLSDLEYARKGTGGPHQDIRAGTYQFMSVEVYLGCYIHLPSSQPIDTSVERRLSQVTSTPPSFNHNVLHELESVWWIMIWAILHRYWSVSAGYSLSQDKLAELREQKALLFDPPNWTSRQKLIHLPELLAGVLGLLPQSPIIVALASQFSFGQSPYNWWYVHLMAGWDKREELFTCALKEFRQFALDLVQCATVSD